MTYYHVTFTKNMRAIRKEGICGMRTTNWVKAGTGERYGEGEIHAFTDKWDAVRWAGKMEWVFQTAMGEGSVSIIEFEPEYRWVEDTTSDPLGRAISNGPWMMSNWRVRPEKITNVYPLTIDLLREQARRLSEIRKQQTEEEGINGAS